MAFDLAGKVCLVTGGSRGVGKGIAVQLAYHGAKCYVTGRNIETLGALTSEVEDRGGSGVCVPLVCDHEDDGQVEKVFDRIAEENNGKLDLLVNNAYSAVSLIAEEAGKGFWEQPIETWDVMNNVGLRNHYRCAVHASKLMVKKRRGIIINVSSIGGLRYLFSAPYGIGKAAKDRMARDCAHELQKYNVAFVSLWPGLVKTETILKVVESGRGPPSFRKLVDLSESPTFVGRVVAALLHEPHPRMMQRTGKIILTSDVGREYNVTDEDGVQPPQMFQLNRVLLVQGYERLAYFIPNFVTIPFRLIRMIEAWRGV